ncbi:MAG: phosphomannose isomerase type II C-terminal cupin domain [Candidatus Nitrosocosmicus sp.]|uniref:phosphomannose isomerase type II C-terminal cupin domain n=1 Tax=Candidatus Nitrosocosmicus agrestis TaxID=2563600 RepID=UPI001E536D2B|nr:phosphomannose isomerase type II C-terminal cupin domain [Candidatus Nitrosocosmicus sp. SS]MDR4492515.1 phosphomannose isomerase type II C-terminal cupin domain [Candidatus Nitrosocosmicus sp.]HET6590874.1 phosphomannose isomerase type II C-terminal cupin domain [Candidatus Nitrosocosmicus sp.]
MIDVYEEERPWGRFEKFIENQRCTVKLLHLKPAAQLSLQYHHKREEWWKVVKGSVTVEVDDNRTTLSENDTIYLPKGCKHRAINLDKPSIILEISLGQFEESDIVRIDDIYNRV